MAVPAHDLSALGLGRVIAGPGPRTWCARRRRRPRWRWWRHRRSAHRLASIRPTRSSSPASAVLSPDSSTRAASGTWTTTKYGLAVVGSVPAADRTDQLQEAVAEALVPRRLAVGGDLCGPGPRGRSWPRHRTRLAAGPSGAELVVEAQEATIVTRTETATAAAPGAAARSCGRPRPVRRTEHALAWSRQLGGRSRVWPRRPPPAPCPRTGHRRTERPDQVRDVPGLLAEMRQPPGGGRRDAEALHGPRFDRGRTLVSIGLAPVDLAQRDDDLRLRGRLHRRKAPSRQARRSSFDMAATADDQCGTHRCLRPGECRTSERERSPPTGESPRDPDLVDRAHHVAVQGGPGPAGDLLGGGRRDRRHPEDVADEGESHQL